MRQIFTKTLQKNNMQKEMRYLNVYYTLSLRKPLHDRTLPRREAQNPHLSILQCIFSSP